MKIAVLSDIHDHVRNLEKAIKVIKEEECEALIFCGDLCSFFTYEILVESNLDVYSVIGDAEVDNWWTHIYDNAHTFPGQEFGEVELEGRRIAFCHTPMFANTLAASRFYDAVFFGHSHRTSKQMLGNTLIANPGAVCGIVGGKEGLASFMIYDTNNNSIKLVKINGNS